MLAVHAERFGERFYEALAARPPEEPPLVAIRNALVPALVDSLIARLRAIVSESPARRVARTPPAGRRRG